MKKIETKVLFRCHGLGQLMTNPTGKSNGQKYEETKEALSKAEIKVNLQDVKLGLLELTE